MPPLNVRTSDGLKALIQTNLVVVRFQSFTVCQGDPRVGVRVQIAVPRLDLFDAVQLFLFRSF